MPRKARSQPLQAANSDVIRLDPRPSTGRRAHQRKPRKSYERRFWDQTKLNANGCLVWTGSKTSDGYGVFKVKSPTTGRWTTRPAHRVAFELTNGVTLMPHQKLLHTCDDKTCVRHTRLGTLSENMQEAADAGLLVRHKLSPEIAREIIRARAEGVIYPVMVAKYGVRAETIKAVIKGKTYARHTADLREEFKEELAWFAKPGKRKPFPGRAKNAQPIVITAKQQRARTAPAEAVS